MEVTKIHKVQIDAFAQIKRLVDNFKKCPKERLTKGYLETRLEILETYFAKFQQRHSSLMSSVSEEEAKVLSYFANDTYESTLELYLEMKTKIKEHLLNHNSGEKQLICEKEVISNNEVINNLGRLPPIMLPKFSGDYKDWISFRDLFTSLVHENSQVNKVNKCQYLKCSLIGDAENLVKQVQVSADNYDLIWNTLNKRYDNPRSLINAYIGKLMNQRKITIESPKAYKDLLDTTNECLFTLKSLKRPTETWDDIVIYIIIQKLDPESHKLFEHRLESKNILPTWKDMEEFLEFRFRTLEAVKGKDSMQIKSSQPIKSFVTELVQQSKCMYCKGDHIIYRCNDFLQLNANDRQNYIQKNNMCFNCLKPGHNSKNCIQSTTCRKCNRKHNTLLHGYSVPPNSTKMSSNSQPVDMPNSNVATLKTTMSDCPVILATALVHIRSLKDNTMHTLRALIDPGSQASLVTEAVCQTLGLKQKSIYGTITGVHPNRNSTRASVALQIESIYNSKIKLNVSGYVLKKLTSNLPQHTINVMWPQLNSLQLADPSFNSPGRIDLILGADIYPEIIQEGMMIYRKYKNPLVAQQTTLGWLITGKHRNQNTTDTSQFKQVQVHHIKIDIDRQLQQFWELEEPTLANRIMTNDEIKCENHYEDTHIRQPNGQYQVRLPFKSYPPDLGDSLHEAMKMFAHLESKFKKQPDLEKRYKEFMKDYIDQQHMELAPKNDISNNVYYLPHHAVINEQHTTTKLRVVFNGSAMTSNKKSLNDNLLTGPALQNDLRDVVLRWRQHAVVLLGDIRQMYRRIWIDPIDRDFQRIVWRPSLNEPIQIYRLTTVTYGTSCAPYLAIKTLKQLALDERDNFSIETIQTLLNDFYVDDLLTGSHDIETMVTLKANLTTLLEKGGFSLHKLASNEPSIVSESQIRQVLGINYNTKTDKFQLKINIKWNNGTITKRAVLRDIAQIYDPAGWLSPIVVSAKHIMQQLWMESLDWDQPLPEPLMTTWMSLRQQLINMPKIEFNRWIGVTKDVIRIELHGFSDASDIAYSAVVYSRVVTPHNVKVTLIEAKTRVAPVKKISTPRLELCGATLLSKLMQRIQNALNVPNSNVYAWTDATIVLAWLQKPPSYWNIFVSNRVASITNIIAKERWSHVTSCENPADVASRGILPAALPLHQLWWNGPTWLSEFNSVNSVPSDQLDIEPTTLEMKTPSKVIMYNSIDEIPSSLESPNSLLYKNVNANQSWHLVREVCKLCCTLRGTISCDEGADDKIKQLHRLFHKRNYKCLCAAICRRRPDGETFYKYIFNRDVWTKIVDLDKKYKLPIRNQWHARTIRESVSLEVPAMRSSASTSHTRTVRTRLFLRTLSENPLQYDLMPETDAETVVTQDLQLIENELNQEEMTATLSALFCHAASLPHTAWLKELTDFLSGDYPVNSKWILAQAICNCKDELKSHTSALYPALLAVVANSITELCGKPLLNGLHVEILNTLTQWRDKERMLLQKSRNDLNTIAYSLVVTAVEYRGRQYAYKSLIDILEVFVNDFKEVLYLEWPLVNQLFKDIRNDFPKTGSKLIQSVIKDRESLINDIMEVIQTNVQNKCWSDVSKLAELLGNAIGCTENETIKISTLEKYRLLLEKVRKTSEIEYMKMLYYSQQGYKGCCDENSLRYITNLVQKLSSHNKTKCLLIISSYISQLNASTENVSDMFDTIDFTDIIGDYTKETLQVIRDGVMVMGRMVKRRLVMATVEYCDHPDVKVRRLAFEVMLKALDDAFQKKTIQPSATKRPKYEYSSSLLTVLKFEDTYKQKLLTALGSGVSDVDDEISGLVRESVCRHLCTDNMAIRFAECFLLTVYLPTTTSKQCLDLSVSLSALLYLFFSDLKSQEAFKNIKLRKEPVRPSDEHSFVSSKLLTMSSTYRGTFRTYTGRRRTNVDRQDESNAINVEISIDYILDTLLQFSKDNSEAAQTLCIEVLKCLLNDTRPDSFDTIMVELLTYVLESGGEFTPLATQMARLFIKFVKDCDMEGFKLILPKLTEICKNTEGESIVRVLSEDVTLRDHSMKMFSMGRINEDVTDVPMSDLEAFDFNEMLSAFDKLSDWDSLTIQERNIIEDTLPRLWTDSVDNFVMETPFEAKHSWLEKMLQVLKDENKQDSFKWLRDMKKWPRSRFYNSAVTEAIQWQSGLSINLEDLQDLPGVSREDCLVKWAARFLARQTYFQSLSHDDDTLCQDVLLLSRSHELRWTKRANEMALPKQALECIRKNIRHLTSNEQLQWMNQKVTTLRLLGLKQKNNNILKEALEIAEETRVNFAKELNPDIVEVNLQVLLLKNDLKDTSPETLRNIKLHVEKLTDDKAKKISSNTKSALKSLYEVMMSNYDEFWDKCEDWSSQSDVLSNMADVLGHVTQAVTSRQMFVDIVLDKLDQYEGKTLPDYVANNILDKLEHENLDDFAIEQIKKHRHLFTNNILSSYSHIWDRVSSGDTSKYKQCLQLIADASHLLAQYCDSLVTVFEAQEREIEWETVFRRIRKSIFENPYAGSDYKLLEDYKNDLYSIEKYDSSEEFKNKAKTILRNIFRVLSSQPPKRILLLSQLCPELMEYDSESDNELERLLGLKGLKVIRFDEQVSVFTDSIRRPTVFRVLISDGKWRRYLVKSGEPLKVDASAQRVRVAITHCGYTVTPLTDDCGIIEYLEDHVRIRDMIKSATSRPLLSDVLESSIKPNEDEIILTPAQVLRQKYEDNCSKIPSYCLRSTIEEKCCSIQDFIMKKQKFENTLVQMTLISSLLGLGDRHLQNIMYSERDGGVCCVDWAAIFKYGLGELPAARLTRNFIAVCNTQALESGLQNAVTMLRKSDRLFAASISMSFKWMGQEFKEKEPHIRKFLNGETASHEITKDVLLKSTKKYKEKYLQLLEEIFDDYEGVQFYSVIDQVSSLLRMSTDLRVLAVTRPQWEPWI